MYDIIYKMQLAIPLNGFDINNVFFSEKKRNVVINGDFAKLFYSTKNIELNELYVIYEKPFTPVIMSQLCSIESEILEKYMDLYKTSKTPVYNLKTQRMNKSAESSVANVLKISGIWETDANIGITLKFTFANPVS